MHINAHQIWSQVSLTLFFSSPPFNKFWRTSLHCKLVIWDCLSKTKSPHILLIPPPPPSIPLPPRLTKTGLFKYARSRRWFVLAREQVPSQAQRSGVSAVTWGLGWPASRLHFPVSADTPTTHTLRDPSKFKNSWRGSWPFSPLSPPPTLTSSFLLSLWSSQGISWISGFTSYKQQVGESVENWGCVILASCRRFKYDRVNKWCFKARRIFFPALISEGKRRWKD